MTMMNAWARGALIIATALVASGCLFPNNEKLEPFTAANGCTYKVNSWGVLDARGVPGNPEWCWKRNKR